MAIFILLDKSFFLALIKMNVVFVLLVAVFALLLYLFATKDSPFVPYALQPKKEKTKSGVINWYAWRGPMFVEDFNDFGDIGNKPGNYSTGMPYEGFVPSGNDNDLSPPHQTSEGKALMDALEGFGNHALPSETLACNTAPRKAKFFGDHQSCHLDTYRKCKGVKLSTSEDAYRNEYHNCSYQMRAPNPVTGDLGNYKQCTNNNLDAPNFLKYKSQGRWDYDITPPKDRISPVCYKRNYDKCLTEKGHRNY